MPRWRKPKWILIGSGLAAIAFAAKFCADRPDPSQSTNHGSTTTDQNAAHGIRFRARTLAPNQMSRISGLVLEAGSSNAVPNVDVIFHRNGVEATAASNEKGEYSVDLEPGSYALRVLGDDVYALLAAPVALAPHTHIEQFDVQVTRFVSISGRVLDQSNGPVEGAQIRFNSKQRARRIFSQDIDPIGTGSTDKNGRFVLKAVPGDVILDAERDGAKGRTLLGELISGQTVQNVEIVLDPGLVVSGLVKGPHDEPIAGAKVLASATNYAKNLSDKVETTTDEEGRFRLPRVASGQLALEASANGYAPSDPKHFSTQSEHDLVDVVLTLGTGSNLVGRVRDESGNGIEGATLVLARSGTRAAPRQIHTEEDGSFEVDALANGRYRVIVGKGGFANPERYVVVPTKEPLEIVLVRNASLSGHVRSRTGSPVREFQMRVERWAPSDGGSKRPGALGGFQYLNEVGEFQQNDLHPGTYDLLFTASKFGPFRLKDVVLNAGKTTEIEAVLEPAAQVRGRVLDQNGKPLVGARVTIITGFEGQPAITNEDGRYQIDDVLPGRRSVHASLPGYVGKNQVGVETQAGQTTFVDIILLANPSGSEREELAGIGASLRMTTGQLYVVSVVPGGPAQKFGVQANDVIMSIDGRSADRMDYGDAIEAIRGPAGTMVTLVIERNKQRLAISVVRGDLISREKGAQPQSLPSNLIRGENSPR